MDEILAILSACSCGLSRLPFLKGVENRRGGLGWIRDCRDLDTLLRELKGYGRQVLWNLGPIAVVWPAAFRQLDL